MKAINFMFIVMMLFCFVGGLVCGMISQQIATRNMIIEVLSSLDGVEINVDINETLMVDRTTENMKEILWDIRMKNCTRTEKHYCALECYENNKLIPCENFTFDEHFCNEGICEVDGICPGYFEILDGKTLTDCIKEIDKNV